MTATNQAESKSPSRRALLAGALGGLGALVASAIGRVNPARASDGEAVLVGGEYTSTSVTRIWNTTNSDDVLYGVSTNGTAVHGDSDSYIGVFGNSFATDRPANVGQAYGNSTGLQGFSGGASSTLPPAKAKTGVYGYAAQDSGSRGVIGESPAGLGVYGRTSTGYAGFFEGKVYTTKWYELTEISTPPNPVANRARLFLKDNGLGKTQLCVKFANGTVKVLATEG
jgi:hypothetical protein